jgi:hypothetical protein
MRKYTGVEKTEVLSAAKHNAINRVIKRFGKTSVRQLSDNERVELMKSLEFDEKV